MNRSIKRSANQHQHKKWGSPWPVIVVMVMVARSYYSLESMNLRVVSAGGTVSSPFDSISCRKHVFKAGENVACNLSSCFHVPSCCVNGADTDARDFSYCFPQFYPPTKVNTYAGQNFTCPGVHYSDYSGIKTDKSDAPLPACCQEAYGTPKQGPIDTTCSWAMQGIGTRLLQ